MRKKSLRRNPLASFLPLSPSWSQQKQRETERLRLKILGYLNIEIFYVNFKFYDYMMV